ncbi:hypothetical protein C7999DRAFT_15312 [Corynascus novoguineensis]|uniref:F-box domain-containing protein n=1 Tax=Corynascus novoguineensis TaxID=1126955 RepID=A0AAN7HMG7_9PEZI|nr:hypothetical protein C7999DRAFT_15312 [Corynascus novoguineensis]
MPGSDCLSNLPLELIEQILDELCHHHIYDLQDAGDSCSRYEPSYYRQHKDESAILGLAGLCRASKHFNRLATWRLYHTLTWPKTGSRWPLIARTLIERRDLAQLVRHLSLDFYESPRNPALPSEVILWYSQQIALFPDGDLYADSLTNRSSSSDFEPTQRDAAIALLTSLCSNLSTLDIVPFKFATAFAFCPPASVLTLRDVEAYDWHGFELKTLSSLFHAAPHLRLLRCRSVDPTKPVDTGLRLEHLTDLDLQNCCCSNIELVHILRMCPNLERLQYKNGGVKSFQPYGYEQFRPHEAVSAIREHAVLLRTFELCLDQAFELGDFDKKDMDEAELALSHHGIECRFGCIGHHAHL